jgi:hypothetical protein
MAEHFWGRHHTMHTSNGGAELLFRAWVKRGERLPPTADLTAVVEFLKARLECADGGRSFQIDPPPTELSNLARMQSFAKIVSEFAGDLARGTTRAELGFGSDRDLEVQWLSQMFDLLDIINAIPDMMSACDQCRIESLTSLLSDRDRTLCECMRFEGQLHERRRRVQRSMVTRDDHAELKLLEQIIARIIKLEPSPARASLLSNYHWQCGELLMMQGDRAASIEAFRDAITAAPEPDKAPLREIAEALTDETAF